MSRRSDSRVGRGFSAVGLHMPKDHNNVGAALRAAGCYDVSLVCVTGRRYYRSRLDTQKAHRHLPLLHGDDLHDMVPFDCVPVAVDLVDDAVSLARFQHPERAFYVFGPEDGTLGDSILSWCRLRVLNPARFCVNLAATVNVVLYDRLAKQERLQQMRGAA